MGDAIRMGGFLVNPDEISGFIETIDGIGDCVVVGVPVADGTKAVAFIIHDPDFAGDYPDGTAVQDLCRHGLAPFKVPVLVRALDVFPLTESPNGSKVQRGALRTLAKELLDE